MQENEVWKPIVGYEKIYSVSNYGRVKRDLPWRGMSQSWNRIKKASYDKDGYCITTLSNRCIRTTARVHKLVAESFLGKRSKKLTVNHKDGIKTNNHIDNLEYTTIKENIRHSWKIGTSHLCLGEKSSRAKLTEKIVKEIRRLYSIGRLNQCQLARKLNISHVTIWKIVNNRTWTHLC